MEQLDAVLEKVASSGFKDCPAYREYVVQGGITGQPHPEKLDEGTSLSLVCLPPRTYNLSLSPRFYLKKKTGKPLVSIEQLEAVYFICQAHQQFLPSNVRLGFLLGDGTGVGKTRILAALIAENRLTNVNTAIWVTANRHLFESAYSEVQNFDPCCPRLDFDKQMDSPNFKNGILFVTYKALSMVGNQEILKTFLGDSFDGLLILDEAHLVKTTAQVNGSKCGKFLDDLQQKHPAARVVYSTATGASETTHLLSMSRLGLVGHGTPFKDKKTFVKVFDKMGVAALELLAMRLKERGVFLARQVSYRGVEVSHYLSNADEPYDQLYRKCCDMWLLLLTYIKRKIKSEKEQRPLEPIWARRLPQFHNSGLNFFESLICSSKVEMVVKKAIDELDNDNSIVIGFQKTGETAYSRFVSHEWNVGRPFSVTADILRGALVSAGIKVGCSKLYCLEKTEPEKLGKWTDGDEDDADNDFRGQDDDGVDDEWEESADDVLLDNNLGNSPEAVPVGLLRSFCADSTGAPPAKRKKKGSCRFPLYSVGRYTDINKRTPTWSVDVVAKSLTAETLARLYHELVIYLPINPLDELYDRFRYGSNDKDLSHLVANCTGHQVRYIYNPKTRLFESQVSPGMHAEMEAYMDKEKRVAIISDAASVGISLHADKSRKNFQKRVHITVQLPFSPDRTSQQYGRSHRSNQSCPPEFVLVSSLVPAEARFMSIVGKRLTQLGAICHGQSKAYPISDNLMTDLCSTVAQSAIKMTIDELVASSDLFRAMWEVIKPSASTLNLEGQRGATKVAATFLNRMLLMDRAMQSHVLKKVFENMEVLTSRGQKVFHPILEFGDNYEHQNVTLVNREPIRVFGTVNLCFLMLELNRTLKFSNIPRDTSLSLGYYLFDGIPCYVQRRSDTTAIVDAFFPFQRVSVQYEIGLFEKFPKREPMQAYSDWTCFQQRLQNIPGCIHRVRPTHVGPCHANCTLHYGRIYRHLLVGEVYDVLPLLTEIYANKKEAAQLGVVTYRENGNLETNIGVLMNDEMHGDVRTCLAQR